MKTTLFIITSTILFYCFSNLEKNSQAEVKNYWSFKDEKHSIILNIDTILCGGIAGEYCRTVKTIDIYSNKTHKKIQTIIPEQFILDDGLTDSSLVFAIEDMNFDGSNDIRLLNWLSTNLQT